MQRLTANRDIKIRERELAQGEEFDMPDREAKILTALGWAHYQTAAVEASAPPKRGRGKRGPDKKPRKPRTYKRRDMVAEA